MLPLFLQLLLLLFVVGVDVVDVAGVVVVVGCVAVCMPVCPSASLSSKGDTQIRLISPAIALVIAISIPITTTRPQQ